MSIVANIVPTAQHFSPAAKNKKIGPKAKNLETFKKSKRKRYYTEDRESEFLQAKECLDELTLYTPEISAAQAAYIYLTTWPTVEPYPLRCSYDLQRKEAWCKFNIKNRPMARLFGCLNQPHHYTLNAKHLNLPPNWEDPTRFYDPTVNAAWKQALQDLFNTQDRQNVLWYKLEASNKTHVHVIASHDAALTHLQRTKQGTVSAVYDELGLVAYLLKPALTFNAANLVTWIEAKRQADLEGRNLPRVRGSVNLPNSRTWAA